MDIIIIKHNNHCPVCNKINNKFKDYSSVEIWDKTKMCQDCQDNIKENERLRKLEERLDEEGDPFSNQDEDYWYWY